MNRLLLATLLFVVGTSRTFSAEEPEEFLVTTARTDKSVIPGASLKRPADFLLQRVKVSSDAREENVRKDEIFETLKLMSAAAARDKTIDLVMLLDARVIPLRLDAATVKLTRGSRADTSETTICVRTKVIPGASHVTELYGKLKAFPTTIKPAGRSAIDVYGDVEVSIVNPSQYREQVVKLYAADSKLVTSTLGAEYRVVTRGIDRQLQWVRDGMTDVTFFISYEYDVIPASVTSYER
jgi:hypothetical protein